VLVRGVPGRPWGYLDHVLRKLGPILFVGGAPLSFATLQMQDAGFTARLIWIVIRTIKGGRLNKAVKLRIPYKSEGFLDFLNRDSSLCS